MKIRWLAEPRALADPQIEVAEGDVVEVNEGAGASLVEQGLAEHVALGKPDKKGSDS